MKFIIISLPLTLALTLRIVVNQNRKTIINKFVCKYISLLYIVLFAPLLVLLAIIFDYIFYIEATNKWFLQTFSGENIAFVVGIFFIIVYLALEVILQFLLFIFLRFKKVNN